MAVVCWNTTVLNYSFSEGKSYLEGTLRSSDLWTEGIVFLQLPEYRRLIQDHQWIYFTASNH